MASWVLTAILFLATIIFTPVESADVHYNLSAGSASASSVCMTDELCFDENDCQLCSEDDFSARAAFDGDPATRWSSPVLEVNASVNFTVTFVKPQTVSSIQVLFGYSNPPLLWNIYYMPTEGVEFLPWLAVTSGPCHCSPPPCLSAGANQLMTLCVDTPDATESVNVQLDELINETSALQVSAVMLEFVSLGASVAKNQMFYSIAEVCFTVLCLDASRFFSAENPTDCPALNDLYQATVEVPAPTGQSPSQLLWLQSGNIPERVAMWYLIGVQFSASSGGSVAEKDVCDPLGNEYDLLFDRYGPRSVSTVLSSDASLVSFTLGVPSSCADGIERSRVELYFQEQDADDRIIAVYDLKGCGDCTNELILRLLQISDELRLAKSLLPPFSILVITDETEINSIKELIQQYQSETDTWLLNLTLTERIYGLPAEYPENVALPEHIQQIEEAINSSILVKLSMLNELVNETTKFQDLREEASYVEGKVGDVEETLTLIQEMYMPQKFHMETDDLLDNLTALLGELTRNLQELVMAVARGNASLALIRSRDYDQFEQMLKDLATLVKQIQLNVTNYAAQSEAHTKESDSISSELQRYGDLLGIVANYSSSVSTAATDVDMVNDQISDLIRQLEELLAVAAVFNSTATLNNVNALARVESSQSVLNNTKAITDEIRIGINSLQFHINTEIKQIVEQYSHSLAPFRPEKYPGVCSFSSNSSLCMAGELHARDLQNNSTTIVTSSEVTITVARSFLNMSHLSDIDFMSINNTALEAIAIGNAALDVLSGSDVFQVVVDTNNSHMRAVKLTQDVETQLAASAMALEEASHELNRSHYLLGKAGQVADDFMKVSTTVTSLQNRDNYTSVAILLGNEANLIIDKVQVIESRLDTIDSEILGLSDKLLNISRVINETVTVLNDTDDQLGQTIMVLAMAADTADKAVEGISGVIDENNELITDIDDLIASVSRTHDLVKKINSPAAFANSQSFLILQPPPSHRLPNDNITIDAIDIYVHIDIAKYPSPALVFYAGPVSDNPEDEFLSSGDYIAITIALVEGTENDRTISLMWRVGQSEGNLRKTVVLGFNGEIYVTRVGSQFELQVTTGVNGLVTINNRPGLQSTVNNASLLFHVTPHTEYLIGGLPPNAFLALPDSAQYLSFVVDYSLLLINGELWSLWDYSKRSNTDFLHATFESNDLALQNIWLQTSIREETNFVLSFDGSGYLKPARFVDKTVDLGGEMYVYVRPVSVSGLILFLYNESNNQSLFEMALVNGSIAVLYNGNEAEISSRKISGSDLDSDGFTFELSIDDDEARVYDDISERFIPEGFFPYGFSPDTKAWIGGIKESELKFPFVPKLTNQSFRGCVNIATKNTNLFDQDLIMNDYLGPGAILKGISGTCLRPDAVLEVGFDGTSTLYYSFVEPLEKTNEHQDVENVELEEQFTLAMSFLTQSSNGVLMGTSQSRTDIVVAVQESRLIVIFTDRNGTSFNLTGGSVTTGEWHYLHLEIMFSSGVGMQRLFVDNALVNATNHNLELPNPQYFSSQIPPRERLALGGPRSNPMPIESELGNFTGCIRDLAYNLELVQLVSGGLMSVPAEGVFFDSCPADVASSSGGTAVLSVFSDPPEDTSCFLPPPARLNGTLGGFGASTELTTSNIVGLFSDKWQINLDIRLAGTEGRVLTIPSEMGTTLTLAVVADTIQTFAFEWTLYTPSIQEKKVTVLGHPTNTWISVEVNCTVRAGSLSCNTRVGNETGTLVVPHPHDTFTPLLPMSFGAYNGSARDSQKAYSFSGCIRNVGINGNQTGFDEISTCFTCYQNMEVGIGFTGIGYISELLTGSNQLSYSISFSFRSERKEGLLLLLTTPSSEQGEHQLLLGIGLLEGQVRVTNFSSSGESQSFVVLSGESLCNSSRTGFTTLSVTATQQSFSVGLQYENEAQQVQMIAPGSGQLLENVVVYFGGVPSTFQVAEGTDPFSFLLSFGSAEDSLPPGMFGCVRNLMAYGTQGEARELDLALADEVVNVLEGLCTAV